MIYFRDPTEGLGSCSNAEDGTALRYAGEFMRQDRHFVLEALSGGPMVEDWEASIAKKTDILVGGFLSNGLECLWSNASGIRQRREGVGVCCIP